MITKVNGQAINPGNSGRALVNCDGPRRQGADKVQIGYSRDGKESTATVTLGTQP